MNEVNTPLSTTCLPSLSYIVAPNTLGNPISLNEIPVRSVNTALTGDSRAIVTDGSRFVRWGDFTNKLESLYPRSVCTNADSLGGEINAEYLTLEDYTAAFDQVADVFPALACGAAKSFNITDVPQQPVNISDIPLGNINQALSSTSNDTLITDGSGRLVRWGPLEAQLTSLYPSFVCQGEKAGRINAEYLKTEQLQSAFEYVFATTPARENCPNPVTPSTQGTVTTADDVLEAYESGSPVRLDLNHLVFNGTNYSPVRTLIEEYPESLEFYHQYGCANDNATFQRVDREAFEGALAESVLDNFTIAANNCDAQIISLNNTGTPLELVNVTTLFEEMAADYSDVGLHLQDNQQIVYNGTNYPWGGVSQFIREDKQCRPARVDNSNAGNIRDPNTQLLAFKAVDEGDLIEGIEGYIEHRNNMPPIGVIVGVTAGDVVLAGGAAYSAFSIIDGVYSACKNKAPFLFNYPARLVAQAAALMKYERRKGRNETDRHPGWVPREVSCLRRALHKEKYVVEEETVPARGFMAWLWPKKETIELQNLGQKNGAKPPAAKPPKAKAPTDKPSRLRRNQGRGAAKNDPAPEQESGYGGVWNYAKSWVPSWRS